MTNSNASNKLNAKTYHHETSYFRGRLSGGMLDWASQPTPFKSYSNPISTPLIRTIAFPDISLWELGSGKGAGFYGKISFENLSAILYLAYGITASAKHAGGNFFYRSVPSAGALYPSELYLFIRDIRGVSEGLYHYDVLNHALTFIHDRPLKPEQDTGSAFYISGIYFRSSWKYRERAYRYILLDSGHLLENLLLALDAFSIPSRAGLNFKDTLIGNWLKLDELHEGVLATVPLYQSGKSITEDQDEIQVPSFSMENTLRLTSDIKYPMALQMHRAGYNFHAGIHSVLSMTDQIGVSVAQWEKIHAPESTSEPNSFSSAVIQRRSRRNFIPRPLPNRSYLKLLEIAVRTWQRQNMDDLHWASSICLGFIANLVEGVQPGFYLVDALQKTIGSVHSGSDSKKIASVCLDQEWLKNASIYFLLITNLEYLDRMWGPRGYRYAVITAGRIGQGIYLGGTALNLGVCGIGAFYDDEARQILGLNSSSGLIYLVAAGMVRSHFNSGKTGDFDLS
jgi:SagB-type dehydrogenase family enzyme